MLFANNRQNIAFQIRQIRGLTVPATTLCDDNLQPFLGYIGCLFFAGQKEV